MDDHFSSIYIITFISTRVHLIKPSYTCLRYTYAHTREGEREREKEREPIHKCKGEKKNCGNF